ncbi:MAG: DUF3298 domain-containing protein [Cytophagales bacterium]|nr:MAG: DUF3298 domain-containing protein [Cytophagales bacterium]
MKIKIFMLIFLIINFLNISQAQTITQETKTYTKVAYAKNQQDTIAIIKVEYPTIVSTSNPAIKEILEREIVKCFFEEENPSKDPFKHLEETLQTWQTEMNQSNRTVQYYLYKTIRVENSLPNIINIYSYSEGYTGGAHGFSSFFAKNIDAQTGRKITLADVFVEEFQEATALLKTAEKEFCDAQGISAQTNLAEYGYTGFSDGFVWSKNYLFKENGIYFEYNEYEIAAYVLGASQFLLPYHKIKKWLRSDAYLGNLK